VRVILQLGLWLAAWGVAFSQVASEKPAGPTRSQLQFEVAAVKMVQSGGKGRSAIVGGPGTSDPERITFKSCTLKNLLLYAYAPTFDIVTYADDPIIKGPAWLVNGGTYEIAAKVPPGSTKEQVRVMLQNLLVDRFKLVIKKETKEVSGYELSVAKGGSKLTESADPNAPRNNAGFKLDNDHFPIIPEGTTDLVQSKGYVTAQNQSMEDLRRFVALKLSTYPSMIVDRTGLKRTYDFKFRTVPGGPPFLGVRPPEDTDGAPSIFEALEKQIGLKLEKAKVGVETFVVESAERVPAEN
jgi:uncharacterized protein (TIGR03435 family)